MIQTDGTSTIAAQIETLAERAAQIVENGYRCRSCGSVFVQDFSDNLHGGHPDNDCPYPNWDKLEEENQAKAIRDLAPAIVTALRQAEAAQPKRHNFGTMERPRVCDDCGYEEHDGSGIGYRHCVGPQAEAAPEVVEAKPLNDFARERLAKMADFGRIDSAYGDFSHPTVTMIADVRNLLAALARQHGAREDAALVPRVTFAAARDAVPDGDYTNVVGLNWLGGWMAAHRHLGVILPAAPATDVGEGK